MERLPCSNERFFNELPLKLKRSRLKAGTQFALNGQEIPLIRGQISAAAFNVMSDVKCLAILT